MGKTRLEKLIERLADIDIDSDLHNYLWNVSNKKEFEELNGIKITSTTKIGDVEYFLDTITHVLYLHEVASPHYFKLVRRLK